MSSRFHDPDGPAADPGLSPTSSPSAAHSFGQVGQAESTASNSSTPADQIDHVLFRAQNFLAACRLGVLQQLVANIQAISSIVSPGATGDIYHALHVYYLEASPVTSQEFLSSLPIGLHQALVMTVASFLPTAGATSPSPQPPTEEVRYPCVCGCGNPSIPRRPYVTSRPAPNGPRTILFTRGFDCGINIVDALEGNFDGLRGRDGFPFLDAACGVVVTVRFEWFGYEAWSGKLRTRNNDLSPVKLSQVAQDIARLVATFIDKNAQKPFNSRQGVEWRVGPGFLERQHLVLCALERVSLGSFQPHLRWRTGY